MKMPKGNKANAGTAANMLGGKDGLSEDNAVMRRLRARAAEYAASKPKTEAKPAPKASAKPTPKPAPKTAAAAPAPARRIASGGTATPRFGNTKPNYGTSTRGPAKPGPEARAPRPGLLDRIVNNDRALRASNRAASAAAEQRQRAAAAPKPAPKTAAAPKPAPKPARPTEKPAVGFGPNDSWADRMGLAIRAGFSRGNK